MKYEGVSHVHSSYSYDGKNTLKELRGAFLARGIRFALMSEHTDGLESGAARRFIQECRSLSDGEFVFVPGFEAPYLGTHVLAYGVSEYIEGPSDECLRKWKAQGALLVVAHPHRNGYKTDRFLQENLDGVEIWNSQYDGIYAPRSGARGLFKRLTAMSSSISAWGGIDLHRLTHINGPRLALDAETLSESGVLARLRGRNFQIKRGSVLLDADGKVSSGRFLGFLGIVMPAVVGCLRSASSLLAKIGIRSFPLKSWLRSRI